MAKVTRRRLSRGNKLEVSATNTEGHVFPELEDMADEFNAARIATPQMEAPNGVFHVFLNLPCIDADYMVPSTAAAKQTEDANYGIPFALFPLREDFSLTTDDDGQVSLDLDESVPTPVLESVSFGFDTRSEPAAVAGRYYGQSIGTIGSDMGTLDYDRTDAYGIRLSIVGRRPWYFASTDVDFKDSQDAMRPTVEVWSTEITPEAYASYGLRINPALFKDINIAMDPGLSYCFIIRAPELLDPTNDLNMALLNVTIDMRFSMEMDVASADQSSAQNRPTRFTESAPTVTITAPQPGTDIEADGVDGIQTGLDNIDDVFVSKLRGGIGRLGEGRLDSVLADYGGYEVIAIPLFNNRLQGGVTGAEMATEPYSGAATDPIYDRGRVTLAYPFVLHRAILGWNWQRWLDTDTTATHIPGPNFTVDVDVSIGAGLRSDSGIVYDQVATHQMVDPLTTASWDTRLIDRIAIRHSGSPLRTATANWDLELHELRIVGTTVAGVSFQDQGERVYMGQTWTPLGARENIGTAAAPYTPGAPNCAGAEQFIEATVKIRETPTGPAATEVVSGYGGHWVYLIGRKYLMR